MMSSDCLLFRITDCSKLTELNLGWTNLSDESLIVLSFNIPTALRRLNLSGLEFMSFFHLELILPKCPDLRELDISGNQARDLALLLLFILARY